MVAYNMLFLTTPDFHPKYLRRLLAHPVWSQFAELHNPHSTEPYEMNGYQVIQLFREPGIADALSIYRQEHSRAA